VSLEALAAIPFVSLARGDAEPEVPLNRLLVAAGHEPIQPALEFSTWVGTVSAVRSGAGAAVIFRSVARRELARGEINLMAVAGFAAVRTIDLICSPSRRARASAVFRELLDYLVCEVPKATAMPEED